MVNGGQYRDVQRYVSSLITSLLREEHEPIEWQIQ
jgi:hypothetical protein